MGEWIKLKASDGFELSAWRAEPKGTPRGGIVVIQEIFGVNHHIRSVTDRFAAEGYLAIAPAVFDRVEPGVELAYDPPGIARGMELAGEPTPSSAPCRTITGTPIAGCAASLASRSSYAGSPAALP